MADFLQDGRHVDYTPGSAAVGGTLVVIEAGSNLCGVVTGSGLAAGQLGALDIEGTYMITKAVSNAVFAVGDWVVLSAAGGLGDATAGATGAHLVVKAAAAGDLKVGVKLNVRPEGSAA